MTTQEILAEYPGLSESQIIRHEPASADTEIEQIFSCASLTWVRDEGNISIWQATARVEVRVDSIKNNQWNGATFVAMNPGDTIRLRINNGSGNHDAFSC